MKTIVGLSLLAGFAYGYSADDLACIQGFSSLEFSLFAYDNFSSFYNETSMVRFSRAGTYTGLDSIEEYISYADSNRNPMYVSEENRNETIQYLGFDGTVCTFLSMYTVTKILGEESDNATMSFGGLIKVKYDPVASNIFQALVYFEPEMIETMFTLFTTEKGWEHICGVLNSSCGEVWTQNGWNNTSDCVSALDALPLLTDGTHFDGLDQGCKFMHGIMVEFNPVHCPHVSIVPMLDHKNESKCQTSPKLADDVDFAPADLVAFRQFTSENGIPSTGVQVVYSGGEFAQPTHLMILAMFLVVVFIS